MLTRNSVRRELAAFPGMVRWYNPRQLSETGLRDAITRVFGQFADQRILQATIDGFGASVLETVAKRYDLSKDPGIVGEDGAVWVDYVADLGDGFDSTFAMASLIARDQLEVAGAGPLDKNGVPTPASLPGGKVLLLGGDQVYPFPSRQNYKARFVDPFAWALPPDPEPKPERRRMFALPGNHDWYDGLNSFDNVFCQARYQSDAGNPTKNMIGGWLCPQHRSYWAIQLPHNWWIWGADIQLSQYLDAGQILYFREVARKMGAASHTDPAKLILCIAEPSWTHDQRTAHEGEQNLDIVVNLALDQGARICGYLAGDLHNYNRYFSSELGMNFITAGGGGAYFSPTHNLKGTHALRFNNRQYKLELKCKAEPGGGKAEACWPSRSESRWHSFRALSFPFRNYGFAFALGIIYWLMSWPYAVTKIGNDYASDLLFGLGSREGLKDGLIKSLMEAPTFLEQLGYVWKIVVLTLRVGIINPGLGFIALGILLVLIGYAEARSRAGKIAMGVLHWLGHLAAAVLLYILLWLFAGEILTWATGFARLTFTDETFSLSRSLMMPLLMFTIGGFVAGLVWGAYLTIACFFKRHCDQAFSSLRLPIFRHFLRMKIEPEKLTIYPVGIRSVPSRKRWQAGPLNAEGTLIGPRFVPTRPFKPELIDGPIVVNAADVTVRDPAVRATHGPTKVISDGATQTLEIG